MEERFVEGPEQFEQILAHHVKSGKQYTDQQFPADDTSIIDPNDDIDDLQDLGPVTWKRIPDIADLKDKNGDLHIFFEEIEPNDIQQG